MVFSSTLFVFLFLPAVIFTYYICPKKYLSARNMILLAFSLAFYFYGEPKLIVVMLLSIAVNFLFGLIIDARLNKGGSAKLLLAAAVALNLGVLFYFKYFSFALENINRLFGAALPAPDVIMPIGISFFTFQGMSYVFDIYSRSTAPQKNPFDVALYISMFPQLIAGPIVRYETIASEIKLRETSAEKFSQGVLRFIYGFGKKLIVANAMGAIADEVFGMNAASTPMAVAWVGAIAYTMQIFFDFSAYSDMAIGLGKIFGFTFLENFNYPYISQSITEFWRRWHISLSTWFRDYVYIPLGGNRVGRLRQLLNIFAVWALTGIWHGAAWNFVVWGLYFAIILVIEKTFLLRLLGRMWRPLRHIYALALIILSWVIFRSESISSALRYASRMFEISTFIPGIGQAYYYIVEYKFEWLAALLFSMPVGSFALGKLPRLRESGVHLTARLCFAFAVFFVAAMYMVSSTFNPFIYFRF